MMKRESLKTYTFYDKFHKLKSKNSTKSISLTLCFNLIIFTINPRKLKNSRNNRIVNS